MKKNTVLIIVILIGTLGGILYYQTSQNTLKPKTDNSDTNVVTVTQFVLISPAPPHEQIVEIQSNQTALALLTKTNKVEMIGTGKDAFVTSINDRAADRSKHEFWAFYVNGKQAQVGAGSYILRPADKIEWKIETY